MSRIILDVTYLAHWQGKLTGIPRVIHELATRYQQSNTECLFVCWDNQAAALLEIDISLTVKNRGSSLHYLPNPAQSASSQIQRNSVRALGKLKRTAKLPIPERFIISLGASAKRAYKVVKPTKGDILTILMGEWHNPDYIELVKAAKTNGATIVQVCYDVLPLVQPQYSGHSTDTLNNYNRQVMPLSDLVLAISENTKRDLAQWLANNKLHVPAIGVFRLGDDFEVSTSKRPVDQAFTASKLKGQDYVLVVGTIEARKNHTLLYYVYKLARERYMQLPKLVIVGRRGWKTDDFYDIATNDPDTKQNIIFLTACDDSELSWLYDNALFSIYPSFYEGWGLPIAESILRGIPCLASSSSSMPEIAGDLLTYFSPASTDECLQGMQQLLNYNDLQIAKQRIKKYKPHTWNETFEQFDKLIKELYE